MIRRFSLYGFLKNQRYFEPFIILFFLQQGLSFTQIGFLIGFRELLITLFEIPSGAFADLFGRRKCMILSFLSYISAFALFGLSEEYWQFFVAIAFFAIGEAFRTGTHKAMIFTWLRIQGRLDEKTKVYGYTRSWSKIGSAVSIVLATAFVVVANDYSFVFYCSIVPYVAGLVNLMTYPKELEGQPSPNLGLGSLLRHLWESLHQSIRIRRLRRLMAETMAFEGIFKAVGDYIQPVIESMVLSLAILTALEETRRIAIIVGAVYFAIYLASAYASRRSHRVAYRLGGEEGGSRALWKVTFVLYVMLVPMLIFEYYYLAIAAFVGIHIMQNLWRPIQISRFDAFATETKGATVLSIESQAKSVSTMIAAPILGWGVDFTRAHELGGEFWPVAAIAVVVTLIILVTAPGRGE